MHLLTHPFIHSFTQFLPVQHQSLWETSSNRRGIVRWKIHLGFDDLLAVWWQFSVCGITIKFRVLGSSLWESKLLRLYFPSGEAHSHRMDSGSLKKSSDYPELAPSLANKCWPNTDFILRDFNLRATFQNVHCSPHSPCNHTQPCLAWMPKSPPNA